ncbi:MAG: hypothetical protein Q4G40_06400 [Brachybacterium sp.]|nr:hypothetical protein [Brachybacterium sp.]
MLLHRPVHSAWPDHDPIPPLTVVLDHAARCLTTVEVAILLESAWNQRAFTADEVRRVIAGLPLQHRRALHRVRRDAESGTETAVRWWLESLGVRVRPQVALTGVGRVDLLVGSSWVIECDSRQFHALEQQYRRDRDRDLVLRSRGYSVTRLTWEQVFLRWEDTQAMLLRIIRRGDHHRRISC